MESTTAGSCSSRNHIVIGLMAGISILLAAVALLQGGNNTTPRWGFQRYSFSSSARCAHSLLLAAAVDTAQTAILHKTAAPIDGTTVPVTRLESKLQPAVGSSGIDVNSPATRSEAVVSPDEQATILSAKRPSAEAAAGGLTASSAAAAPLAGRPGAEHAQQTNSDEASESQQVQAIVSDPQVVAAIAEGLQKAFNATAAVQAKKGKKAALEVIDRIDSRDVAPQEGQVQLSSRVKALAVAQIGNELDSLVQPHPADVLAPALEEAAPEEHAPSGFAQQVSWDTPVEDTYGDQYFAMCLAIKNQHQDIREWVGHHKAVGAGKVYLFDGGSEPPLDSLLKDYTDSGFVEHIWSPPNFGTRAKREHPQLRVYTECMERFGSRHQFLGYLDSDEFLILGNGTPSVPALLRRMMAFEPFGGLVVNWRMFGSSGHRTRPKGGVLNSYSKCLSFLNGHTIHIKSIVNTELAKEVAGPHHWNYKDGFYAVNEHFQKVIGPKNENVTTDKIAIHHYVLKSFEEYLEKSARGSAMGNHKPLSFFRGINAQATHTCPQALQLGPYP